MKLGEVVAWSVLTGVVVGVLAIGCTEDHYRHAAVDRGFAEYTVNDRGHSSWDWVQPIVEIAPDPSDCPLCGGPGAAPVDKPRVR